MALVNFFYHTIDESLLSGGTIIDIGCRDFKFASHFKKQKVYCIDIDESVFINAPDFVTTINVGISDKDGDDIYYRNGEMTKLEPLCKSHSHLQFPCKTITMKSLYAITGKDIDVLKLDCEGAEYLILGEGFLPVPKQITVEFHFHTVPEVHAKNIDKVMGILKRDYDLVHQNDTLTDCLFIKRS